MLNLDQVRLLENRVEKAVNRIKTLTEENAHVCSQLSGLQARVNELEGLVRSFKDDQGRIEEGILNALDRLSAFEDSVYQTTDENSESSESVAEIKIEQTQQAEPEIEADWLDSPESSATGAPPHDGQMDIF